MTRETPAVMGGGVPLACTETGAIHGACPTRAVGIQAGGSASGHGVPPVRRTPKEAAGRRGRHVFRRSRAREAALVDRADPPAGADGETSLPDLLTGCPRSQARPPGARS